MNIDYFDIRHTFTDEVANTRSEITSSYVPSGAKSFDVASWTRYNDGDKIIVARTTNQTWLDDNHVSSYLLERTRLTALILIVYKFDDIT